MRFTFKTLIYLIGIYLIFTFIGTDKYNTCEDSCIFKDVGIFLAIFILISYSLLFYENMRKKVFLLWKVYIPAMFVLYTAIYYIDITQYEENLKNKEKYIDFRLKYASTDFKNIKKDEANKVLTNDLKDYNEAFEKYVNEILNGYKVIIGKAMIGLHIGILSMMLLLLINIYFKRETK